VATATRDITTGEQIVMNYVPTAGPLQDRQRRLWVDYGFHCRCGRCLDEASAAIEDSAQGPDRTP